VLGSGSRFLVLGSRFSDLRPPTSDLTKLWTVHGGPATYAGYLVVSGELRPLPVGSSLDPSGTFYWHPGPGFFGAYHVLFVRTSCDGAQRRIPVSVRIR